MNNITKRLRHSVEVWHMIDSKNELGENEKIPEKFKNAFSEIVPQNSSVKQGQAETESNEHQFKFTFRRKSVQGIQKDWFLYLRKKNMKLSISIETLKIINSLRYSVKE